MAAALTQIRWPSRSADRFRLQVQSPVSRASGQHGARSSMVERSLVVADVAGSNPVGHPN